MDKTTLKQLKPGTLIMKLSSKEPEQYSLILHIRHYEHQKPIQQIS